MINVDDDGDAGDSGDDGDGGDVDDDGDDGDYDDDDDGDDGEREDECSSRSIRMSSRAQPLRPLTMNISSIEQLITIIVRSESEILISHLSALKACLKQTEKVHLQYSISFFRAAAATNCREHLCLRCLFVPAQWKI